MSAPTIAHRPLSHASIDRVAAMILSGGDEELACRVEGIALSRLLALMAHGERLRHSGDPLPGENEYDAAARYAHKKLNIARADWCVKLTARIDDAGTDKVLPSGVVIPGDWKANAYLLQTTVGGRFAKTVAPPTTKANSALTPDRLEALRRIADRVDAREKNKSQENKK